MQIDKGTWYEPDIEFWGDQHFGVEVKTIMARWLKCDGHPYGHIGRLRLPRSQWDKLCEWCKQHEAYPLLIVEIRTRTKKAPFLYRKFNGSQMEKFCREYSKAWVAPTIWELIELGERL